MTNRFHNQDGDQNIGQGEGAVGKQVNDHRTTTQTIDGNENMAAGRDINITNINHPAPTAEAACVLPSEDDIFLHRKEELAWLDKHLAPDRVVAVCGPGGMGKSALAAHAVRRLPADRFPDGIVFHTFYHQAETAKALQTIARAFHLPTEEDLKQEVALALGRRQALLILDGAEEAEDLPAVLRLRGRCGVLITTRRKSDCGPLRWDLQALPDEQAEEVLRAWGGEAGEQEAIEEIAELLGGWPVALRLAGHYLHSTGEPATDYLRWLEEEPFNGLVLSEENRAGIMSGIIQRSVDQLSKQARVALEIIGAMAFAPFREGAVVSLLKHFNYTSTWGRFRVFISLLVHRKTWIVHSTEKDLRFCHNALDELVNLGLLERQGQGWQVSHILIYGSVRREMPLADVSLKLLAWYYRVSFKKPSKTGAEGCAQLEAELVHCLRVMETCLDRGEWREVQGMAKSMWEYLNQHNNWTEQLAAQNMRLTAARKTGDRYDEVTCYHMLGYDCGKRGEHEQAITYYTSALKRARKLNDTKEQILLLDGIALSYQDLDKHDQALECYQQGLRLCQETGDREQEKDMLEYIGQLFEDQDNYEQAIEYYKQALALMQEAGDRSGEAAALDNIAAIYFREDQFPQAMKYHEHALNIFYELGDRDRQAESLINIGFTQEAMGELARAEESMTLAVEIAEALELPELDDYREGLEQVRARRQAG